MNFASSVVAFLILCLTVLALRKIFKDKKNELSGKGCSGCGGCGGCGGGCSCGGSCSSLSDLLRQPAEKK